VRCEEVSDRPTVAQMVAVVFACTLALLVLAPQVAKGADDPDVAILIGSPRLAEPAGVALDASGKLYIADTGNNRVRVLSPSGTTLRTFGSPGSGDGQFNSPWGVALDSSGNIYVSDSGNNRVQKFDSAGTFLSQFGGLGSGNGQFSSPRGMRGKCVRPVRANRRNRRCTRQALLRGAFTDSGAAGRNALKFSGRLGGIRLPPGQYWLRAIATDDAGNASAPKWRAFRIAR